VKFSLCEQQPKSSTEVSVKFQSWLQLERCSLERTLNPFKVCDALFAIVQVSKGVIHREAAKTATVQRVCHQQRTPDAAALGFML
jgi:hypothetical protein